MSKQKGSGTVIISTPDATATYTASSVTVTPTAHSNVTLSSGAGLIYTAGTGITAASDATWSVSNHASGVIHAKDFIIDGELSLREVLEQRLNMLVPNPEMEKEWNKLKELGDQYRELEKECIEKSRMWKTLKKTA